MKQRMGFSDELSAVIERHGTNLPDIMQLQGVYDFEVLREGKIVLAGQTKNAVCTVGKNSLLDVYFRNQSQLATWYFGLVDSSGFTAFAPTTDTMSSHAGWTESVAYSDSTRQAWSPGAASGASITNGTVATFNINGTATLQGGFITSGSAKSGTSGILWSEAAFSGGTVGVVNGDALRLTYTLSC